MEVIKRYCDTKGKGNATLARINQSFAVEFRQYDKYTGEVRDPEVIAVGLKEINNYIAELEAKLANAKAMKTEMESLGVIK